MMNDMVYEVVDVNKLIDFSKLPNGMISCQGTEEVNLLADASMGIYPMTDIDNLLSSFDDDEYPDLGNEVEQELNALEDSIKNKWTLKQELSNVKILKDFLSENHLPINIENMPVEVLANYLRLFYSKLRRKDGNLYSTVTLLCIRSSINRYLNSSSVKRNVNIVTDKEFASANNMLKVMVGQFMKNGGRNEHYEPIETDDFEKLARYFDRSNPQVLQEEAIYTMIYYFGLRGRESLRSLTKRSICFDTDASGQEYAYLAEGMISKNTKPSLSARTFTDNKQGRIYETPESPNDCPIKCLKLYFGKLPNRDDDNLFPKPLTDWKNSWYSVKAVRGKSYLGDTMKMVSQKANLSKTYTNHCIRATVVSNMLDAGFDLSDIAAVTGHKSEDALRKYCSRKRPNRLREFSASLSKSMRTSSNETQVEVAKSSIIDSASTCEISYIDKPLVQQTNSVQVTKEDTFRRVFGDNCVFGENCSFNISIG